MKSIIIAGALIAGFAWVTEVKDFWGKLQARSVEVNSYERQALFYLKENRGLKAEVNRLKFEMKALEAKVRFLELKLDQGKSRTIASQKVIKHNDMVQFDVYKWKPQDMVVVAQSAFKAKDYEKSAQFFHELMSRYGKDKAITEEVIYQAGMSAYKAGHYEWSIKHFSHLISSYPTSKFFRGSKLWLAMSHHEVGEKDKFFKTVEEFRLKYRNTDEWKILSKHYENFYQKYK